MVGAGSVIVLTISILSATIGPIGSAQAQNVLIINGASGTSEPATTGDITTNLNILLQDANFTTTISDGVPINLTGFNQIWDIRFSNNLAITSTEETQYLGFLQGGGGMFVMGENSSFPTRNNSVLSLIQAAGGGSLNFTTPLSTQGVLSPFDMPNTIPSGNVTYAFPGGVTSFGTGQFITVDSNGDGTGVAFAKGTLGNAPNGVLTTIFDVNFMEASFNQPNSQNLLKNLIGFIDEETNGVQTVPEPTSTLSLLALGTLGAVSTLKRKLKPSQSTEKETIKVG